jgi:hypothetical protein
MSVAKTTEGARRLSGQSLEALYALLRDKDTPKNAFTSSLGHLLWFADERAESVLRLVRGGCLWDADIIFRCFNEAYVKFLFLCFLNESERESSISEFMNDLWAVHDLRTSERSEELLSVKDIPPGLTRALKELTRPGAEIAKLKTLYPSKRRDALSKKWSFPNMVLEVSRFFEETHGTKGFVSMLHQYGLSSHFVHADETALGIMEDRANRESAEREKLCRGHAARMLSDLVWSLFMMRSALAHALKRSFPDDLAKGQYAELQEYSESLRREEEGFWQTQPLSSG